MLNVISKITLALALALVLTQCDQAIRLAQPPNILVGLGAYPDAEIPAHLRTTTPRIYYITDRQAVASESGDADYGYARSTSMAFGYKTISFGPDLTWEQLKLRSVAEGLNQPVHLTTLNAQELVRFPPTPLPFTKQNGRVVESPAARRAYQQAKAEFKAAVRTALRQSNRQEALVYVHGIRNDFKDGAATLSNLWHYSGRIGVPIVYTWPSDAPGLFGYFTDRESSEFSIFHFKEFIRLLTEIPELKRINLVAHSQGAELATTGLLELSLANGKRILVGVDHIQAILTSGVGVGSLVVLGGGLSYELAQTPQEIADLMDAHYAKTKPA